MIRFFELCCVERRVIGYIDAYYAALVQMLKVGWPAKFPYTHIGEPAAAMTPAKVIERIV